MKSNGLIITHGMHIWKVHPTKGLGFLGFLRYFHNRPQFHTKHIVGFYAVRCSLSDVPMRAGVT